MKKILILLLALFLLCGCAAEGEIPADAENNPIDVTGNPGKPEIPKLFIEAGEEIFTANSGSHEWEWDNGDGTMANEIACGIHPTGYDDIITISGCNEVKLVFDEVVKAYTITAWEEGETYENGKGVAVEAENGVIILPDDGKSYIYEVDVTYEHGTVEYGFRVVREDPWGLQLSVKNVTPEGATVVFTQSGGSPTGELETGSYFKIEYEDEEMAFLIDDVAWTAEAYIIPKGGNLEMEVNWRWLYGKLEPGTYRIYKSVMDFRGPGDYDSKEYSAQFIVE